MYKVGLKLGAFLLLCSSWLFAVEQTTPQQQPPPPSISVAVTSSPTTIYVGGTVGLSVVVTASSAASAVKEFKGTCTSSEYDYDEPLSFPPPSNLGSFYTSATTVNIQAPEESGQVPIVCSVTADLANGKFITGNGTTTFNVTACQGVVEAAPVPTIQLTGPAENSSTWNGLTGVVEPSGLVSAPKSASGFGITGQLDNTALPANLLDCDGDPNDNIAEQNASIAGIADPPANGQVVFSWTVTSYTYSTTNPCESCEVNPSGHYPISGATQSMMPSAATSSQYCQQ